MNNDAKVILTIVGDISSLLAMIVGLIIRQFKLAEGAAAGFTPEEIKDIDKQLEDVRVRKEALRTRLREAGYDI